jgi:predicted TIM-barrel fold metal-dependent hydrolase
MDKRFYNCHAHCFTYDHVPERFLSPHIAISWLLDRRWLKDILHNAPITGKLGFFLDLVLPVFGLLFGLNRAMAMRYVNFLRYGYRKTQEDVIQSMQAYYPKDTGLVMLSMDMEYMGAGLPKTRYEKQLSQLAGIKLNPSWNNKIYPFIFCDPRRLEPKHSRETAVESNFTGPAFLNAMKDYLTKGTFQGIKIYPALGYHAFDKRMKPAYDFAVANEIPVLSHCTIGAVHFKYKLDETERCHPFLGTLLPDTKSSDFQKYFTHPLNFECLLNQEILKHYWGPDAPDYKNLKICLAHWGNGDDWHNYLDNPWLETSFRKKNSEWCALELDNWIIDESKTYKNFSWFTIICNLIRKYPNVYTDISYTLNDTTLIPLLKMILESNKDIRERVLFGTDFYLVSKAISERAFAINIRAALGVDLFEQIAVTNAERFLGNKFASLA